MGEKPITANEMGRRGGSSRAKRYSRVQIRAWGKLGGRPRKLSRTAINQMLGQVRRGEAKAVVAKAFGMSVRTLDRYLAR